MKTPAGARPLPRRCRLGAELAAAKRVASSPSNFVETGSTVSARLAPKARLLQTAFVGHRAACSLGLPGAIGKQEVSPTDETVPENALAGIIPTEIGQLAELRELDAAYNQLTGACLLFLFFFIDGLYHCIGTRAR